MVETLIAGFPNKEHSIDTTTGIPKCLALNIMIEALTKNAPSISTPKRGGVYGHTVMVMMSAAQYATIQYNLQFALAPPPGELIFTAGDLAVGCEDTKLLYYRSVYDFELGSHLAAALKNILMDKLMSWSPMEKNNATRRGHCTI